METMDEVITKVIDSFLNQISYLKCAQCDYFIHHFTGTIYFHCVLVLLNE